MAKSNKNLSTAKKEKNDEFYTQLGDIEKELVHYREHFKGKTILCNCNDAIHTNFAKYFSLNFEFLGLKKLVCTAYNPGKVCIYNGDKNGNGVPDIEEWKQYELKENGDFRSDECVELLKEADIVVTNPPFSLFREYVALLMKYEKKFVILGNKNAITYKEIFPLIKDNQMWLGVTMQSGGRFIVEDEETTSKAAKCMNGVNTAFICGAHWFTNLDHKKRHEELDLYKHYNAEEYPKYDNYDAIEVSKTCDIPTDYDGVMGVPITFLDKYCPEQFEIIGLDRYVENNPKYGYRFTLKNKETYARILIKGKNEN